MRLLFLLLLAGSGLSLEAECVPMRWPWSDPASLTLLENSSINCLIVEGKGLTSEFLAAAHPRKIQVFAQPGSALKEIDGCVSEGEAPPQCDGKLAVHLGPRKTIRWEAKAPVLGTTQGLWPGIRVEQEGKHHSGPTGAPWIETNTGFLRYARSAAPASTFWMANRPPEGSAWPITRYLGAVADSALAGAHWVITLESGFAASLEKKEPKALADWKRLNEVVTFYESQREFSKAPDTSELLILQDPESGALISGGILDMIGAKHIPARILPSDALSPQNPDPVKMLLNIDPAGLNAEEAERVKNVARQGATVVNGPPAWKIALPEGQAITFRDDQIKQLDEIWREVNGLLGRRNFGVRVFGAPGMLSTMKLLPDGRIALHLVNYTDYPVESISLHFTRKLSGGKLLTPQGQRKPEFYPVDDGTGVDIDRIHDVGILVLDPAQPNR